MKHNFETLTDVSDKIMSDLRDHLVAQHYSEMPKQASIWHPVVTELSRFLLWVSVNTPKDAHESVVNFFNRYWGKAQIYAEMPRKDSCYLPEIYFEGRHQYLKDRQYFVPVEGTGFNGGLIYHKRTQEFGVHT